MPKVGEKRKNGDSLDKEVKLAIKKTLMTASKLLREHECCSKSSSEREDPPTLQVKFLSKDQYKRLKDLLNSFTWENEHSEKHLIGTSLREQCQLEQKAKAHLEDNFQVILQKKDNRISVLETQFERLDQKFNEAKKTIQELEGKAKGVNELEQTLPIIKVLVKPAIVPATILLTYPPPPSPTGSITVNSDDLTTLEDGKYLNDTIIDFYLKFLFHTKLSNLNKSKTYIFSTYFYTCLMKAGDDVLGRHKKVQAWTKNVDLFMKTHIIIPVNQNQHWILVLLCNPGEIKHHENSGNDVEKPPDSDDDASSEIPDGWGKTPYILIFDSVNSNHSKIVSTIRSYLNIEWITKKKTQVVFDDTTMPYFGVKCPQQTNGYDCGVYLLQNFENFFQTPSLSFGEVMSDLSDWFTPDTISGKRTQIKKLIMDLTLDPNALTTIGVEEKHCSI